jgi:hypothetical protein
MSIGSGPIGSDSQAGSATSSVAGGGGGAIGGRSDLCDDDTLAPLKLESKLGFFGAPCCCPCTSFTDDFTDESLASHYIQLAGSWSETGGHLETADAAAILYLCGDREALNWAISADISSTGDGDKLRLNIGGHGSRIIAEVELNTGGSGTLRLFGTNGVQVDSVSVTATTLTTYRMRICSTASGTTVYFGQVGGLISQKICSLTPGMFTNRVGLETGALGGTATFDNLVVEEAGSLDCPCNCLLNSDNFNRSDGDPGVDWVQDCAICSGTWTISGNQMAISDANALIFADPNGFGGSFQLSTIDDNFVSADVTASAAGDQVIVGMNKEVFPFSLFPVFQAKLEFQVGANNGSLEILADSAAGPAKTNTCAVTAEPGTTYNLKICYAQTSESGVPVTSALLDDVLVVSAEGIIHDGLRCSYWRSKVRQFAPRDDLRRLSAVYRLLLAPEAAVPPSTEGNHFGAYLAYLLPAERRIHHIQKGRLLMGTSRVVD